jgi:hypothetical protein
MTQFHTVSEKGIKFDNVTSVIGLLCKVYGLEEATKVHPVEISDQYRANARHRAIRPLGLGLARPLCLSSM